ncbi:MAG: ATP:cob(I)alamin adenosyltransferase [Flavobacteriaceae bacterium]|nr:ATP:cob(I)alamin adenosyltransferase [Flavobacteriaceae bacterium]|tara:strand:+ start:82110 stop:82682 length:573 start_codon:yes stop_codon:yes gene_type:complete
MKIYTKTGDKGTTALFSGARVPKYNLRIESYGTVDELNSYLGLIKDQEINTHYQEVLYQIQNDLFVIGSMLATPPQDEKLKSGKDRLNIFTIDSDSIRLLEREIDAMDTELEPMTNFILPGGHTTVSYCHIARCICRRAERLVVELNENEAVADVVLQYLNRLSDYLFVLARKLTKDLKVEEIKWIPNKK